MADESTDNTGPVLQGQDIISQMLQALGGGMEQLQSAMGESQIQQNQVVTISQESITDIEAAVGRAVGPLVPAIAMAGEVTEVGSATAVETAMEPEQAADLVPSAQEIETKPDVLDVNLVSLGEGAETELSTLFGGLFNFDKLSGKPGAPGAPGGGSSGSGGGGMIAQLGGLLAGAGVGTGAVMAGSGYGAG